MKIIHLLITLATLSMTQALAMAADKQELEITVEALEDPNNPLHVLNKVHQGSLDRLVTPYIADVFGGSLDNLLKPFGKNYELSFVVNNVEYGVVFLRLQGPSKELSLSNIMKKLNIKRIIGFEKGRRTWEAQDKDYHYKGILVLDRLPTKEARQE